MMFLYTLKTTRNTCYFDVTEKNLVFWDMRLQTDYLCDNPIERFLCFYVYLNTVNWKRHAKFVYISFVAPTKSPTQTPTSSPSRLPTGTSLIPDFSHAPSLAIPLCQL